MTLFKTKNEYFIDEAKKILENSGLVAFPTETVYGLGADARNENACKKIFRVKGRPSDNPLIVHIGMIDQLEEIVLEVPDSAKKMIKAFWPGPLTMIFKKKSIIPPYVTGGLDTVAVRMPSDETALKLLIGTNIPIAAPSANLSGKPSPTRAIHVLEDLDGKIDMVIDGGDVEIGIESTIVDVTDNDPKILRPGFITKEMIEEVIGQEVKYEKLGNKKPKAPGMKYKHYAPKGSLILLDGSIENVIKYINSEMIKGIGKNIAIITTDEHIERLKNEFLGVSIFSYGSKIEDACKNCYGILRRCDNLDIDLIYSTIFIKSGRGYSIMNRLEKAAELKIVKL